MPQPFILTEAGRLNLEASKRILEQVGEAERTAMGVFKITAPIVFGRTHMIPIIAEFLSI